MDQRKKKSTNTNRMYMDFKEIIRESVLRYLPAKALYRARAVNRDWKLFISTPFFIHNQSVSFTSISGFFLQAPGSPVSFISLDEKAYGVPDENLKFLPEPVVLKGSSNGLLCCQGLTGDKPYYVCNPANQQWKKLPKPTVDHGYNPAVALVYEPSLLNFMVDYKVVCIFPSSDIEEAYEFEIYSSLQDSWKVSAEMFFSKKKLQFGRGITIDGVAYWPTSSGKILIFDLKKEKAMETYSYHYDSGFGTSSSPLGMIDGELCMSSVNGLSITINALKSIHANTMPMRSMNKGWVMKQVQLNSAPVQSQGNGSLRVLFTWDNSIVLDGGGKVFLHDISSRTTKVCAEAHTSGYEVFPYVNSLVPLN